MDDLCMTATRLINRHLDFDALMNELQDVDLSLTTKVYNPKLHDSPKSFPNVEIICESMKLQATMSEMTIDVAANQMILKKLCKISEKQFIMLTDEHLTDCISAFKRVSSALNVQDLSQYQSKFQHCLPLNILIDLQDNDVLHIKDYLIVNVNDKGVLKEFVWSLQQVTRQNSSEIVSKTNLNCAFIEAGILTHLIRYAYSVASLTSKALKKMCGYILFKVVESHLQYLSSLAVSKQVLSDNPSIISIIRTNLQNEEDILQKCFLQMISLWVTLTDCPNFKVSHAISTQHTWIAGKQNEQLTTFYKEMTLCLGLEKSIATLNDILERREVNWKNLLTLVSAILVSFPESPKKFSSLISEKLKSGLETFSVELLFISFLLVRQLSLEGSHAFTTYTSWFQENFGINSSLISSNRSFRFFIKFLSDIIPYEPVRYLKAHIIKPPHSPASCIEKLREYSSLARVKIAELGGSLSETIEEPEQMAEVVKDVKNIVEEYEKSHKIPKSLMEASIFQKSYFCKKFLPTLMKPRPLPTLPDSTMKLIKDLLKSQKIPKSMYAAYKDGCEKEIAKLLQEVIILDGDSEFEEEEKEKNSREQFVNVLNIIKSQIYSGCRYEGENANSLSTEMFTKLNRILHSVKTGKCVSDNEVNLHGDYKIHDVLFQMAEELNDWLGLFHDNFSSNENLREILSVLLKMTSEHRHFTEEICHLIWRSCTDKVKLLKSSDLRLKGMSLYLAIIGNSLQVKIPLLSHSRMDILKSSLFIKSVENWQTLASSSLFNTVQFSLDLYKEKGTMLAALKVVCFLVENLISLEQDVSPNLLNLFLYIGARFEKSSILKTNQENLNGPPSKCAKTDRQEIFKSIELHQKLYLNIENQKCKSLKMSIDEFLRREIRINMQDDILTFKERKRFYGDILFGNDLTEKSITSAVNVILDEISFDNENGQTIINKEVLEYIFKSFPLIIENCESIKSVGKFFLDIIKSRVGLCTEDISDISKDIQWQNEVKALGEFVLRLPSTFLFQSSTMNTADTENIWNDNETDKQMKEMNLQFVAQLINEYFFNSEIDATQLFSLSNDLSALFISGFIEVNTFEEFIHFSITACPCLFISLIVNWRNDQGLKLFMKLRSRKLHHVANTVCESLHENTPLQQAIDILKSNLQGCLINNMGNQDKFISMCIACIYLDFEEANDVKNKMEGLSMETVGFIAFFAILKMTNYNEMTSSAQNFYQAVLEACFETLNCEYLCKILLRGKLADDCSLLLTKAWNVGGFSFYLLKCLLQCNVPINLLKSRLFLPTLLHLREESDRFFNRRETLSIPLTDVEPGLQNIVCLAVKHAPDSALIDSLKYLKKSNSTTSSVAHILKCEAVKRKNHSR